MTAAEAAVLDELESLLADIHADAVAVRADPDHDPDPTFAAKLADLGARWPAALDQESAARVVVLQVKLGAAVAELHAAMAAVELERAALDDESRTLRTQGEAHRNYAHGAARTQAAVRREQY